MRHVAVAVLAVCYVQVVEPNVVRAVPDVDGVRARAALVIAVAAVAPHGEVADDDVADVVAGDANVAGERDARALADDRLVGRRSEGTAVVSRLDEDDGGAAVRKRAIRVAGQFRSRRLAPL